MIWLYIILPIIAVVFDAFTDWLRISKGRKINHFWGAVLFSLSALIPFVLGLLWWKAIIITITTRMALFDSVLNIMRGKSWLYENPASGSWVDKIESLFNIQVFLRRIIYLIIYIGSIFIL